MKRSEMTCSTCVYGEKDAEGYYIVCRFYPYPTDMNRDDWCGQGMWPVEWDKQYKCWDNRCWGEWEPEVENG